MQRNLLAASALALLAPLAQASGLTSTYAATFSGGSQNAAVTISFSGLTLGGFDFQQITASLIGAGSLVSVSVNATLDASENYTYADDLTIYIDALPLSTGGLVQVGGFSDLSAAQRYLWSNGGSSAPGTTVIDTVVLTTPIQFTGGASDPAIWLGNGYGDPDTLGTWTGSITLNMVPVPEPGTWALMLAGTAGVLGFAARRRRSINAAR